MCFACFSAWLRCSKSSVDSLMGMKCTVRRSVRKSRQGMPGEESSTREVLQLSVRQSLRMRCRGNSPTASGLSVSSFCNSTCGFAMRESEPLAGVRPARRGAGLHDQCLGKSWCLDC